MAKKLYRMLAVLTALCILLAGAPAGAEGAENGEWWKNTIAYEIYIRS